VVKEHARELRRAMTDAEMRLWFRLRPLRREGLAFRRQSPVGRYILDFECRRAKLGIELDGSQHANGEQAVHDAERTAWFEMRGYRILRYWNVDILHETDYVVDEIIRIAASRLSE
jgi:very-short-patch-repair endonuclease